MKLIYYMYLCEFSTGQYICFIITLTMHQDVPVLSFGQFMQNIYVHVVVWSCPSLTFYFPVFQNGSVWKQRTIDNFIINIIITFFATKHILSFWNNDWYLIVWTMILEKKSKDWQGKSICQTLFYFAFNQMKQSSTNVSWVWFLHSAS